MPLYVVFWLKVFISVYLSFILYKQEMYQVPFAENRQIKININMEFILDPTKTLRLPLWFRHCIFASRVTWNFAYSPYSPYSPYKFNNFCSGWDCIARKLVKSVLMWRRQHSAASTSNSSGSWDVWEAINAPGKQN